MTNEGRNQREGMEPRDDQALWALLGRELPPAKASPYFARRVLREVARTEEARMVGWWGRARNAWSRGTLARRAVLGSGLSGACAVALLVVVHAGRTPLSTGPSVVRKTAETRPPADFPALAVVNMLPVEVSSRAKEPMQDVEVIADLDNALQREESRLWTEDSARF